MQLEALWGNRAFFLKCNYKGNRGRAWGQLRRTAEICVDRGELWRAYSALPEFLAPCQLYIKSKEGRKEGGKEGKGKERKGKERKGKERKGKERRGEDHSVQGYAYFRDEGSGRE